MGPDISLPDAQGLWLRAHTPVVTRSRVTMSTRDQWAQPAFPWSHPVPCHCSHWCQQLLAGSHAGYTVQEEWLWAPAAIQHSAAPRDCCCQDQSLAESGTVVTNLPQRCCLEGKFHPAPQLREQQWLWHNTPVQGTHPRQSWDGHTPDPAQLLLQFQQESSRVGAGGPSWLEGPLL